MRKRLLLVFGIVELLFPKQVIGAAERVAFENPADCQLRGWTVPIARLEGIAYLAFVLRGGASAPWFRRVFGLFGALAFLFPQRCMGFGTRVAYRNSEACEWKPWVELATRVVGLLMVVSLYVFPAIADSAEVREASETVEA